MVIQSCCRAWHAISFQRKVDVLVVGSTNAAQELKRITSSIPIVIALVADPQPLSP
jgi:ABC-type uncharacterized transport system substrate-binding protein